MRRFIIATAIAMMVGAGGVIGMATAADGPGPAAWSEIPDVLDGSVFVYTDATGATHRYTVHAGPELRGADGLLHKSRLLNAQIYLDERMHLLQIGAGTGRQTSEYASTKEDVDLAHFRMAGPSPVPCGWETTLRGSAEAASTIEVGGACAPEGSRSLSRGVAVEFAGRAAWIYQDSDSGLALTYATGIPVPVQIEDAQSVWVLTHWNPGADPLPSAAEGEPLVVPDAAPMGRYGPQGIEGIWDFDLVAAVEAARADVEDRGTAEFLAAHPDWRVGEATGAFRDGPDWQTVIWKFTLLDGTAAKSVDVIHDRDLVVSAAGLHEVWLESTRTFSRDTAWEFPVAESMGSVDSAVVAWRTFVGPDRLVRDIQFRPDVHGALMLGDAPIMGIASSGTILGRDSPQPREGLTLVFDAEGRIVGKQESLSTVNGIPPESRENPGAVRLTTAAVPVLPLSASAVAATGAAGVAAGALYLFWPYLKAGFGWLLFSRVRSSDALEHPVRQKIMEAVKQEPGIHYRELVRQVGAGNGTVEHHAGMLVKSGLIVRRSHNGYACFFPDNKKRPLPVKSDGAKAILLSVQSTPGASPSTIARETGLDEATVRYHLGRLHGAKRLEIRTQGRAKQVFPL